MTDRAARSVRRLIDVQCAERPDAVYAVDDQGRELRFGDIGQAVLEAHATYRRLGVRRDATVSVVMPNGLQTLRLLLGTMGAGYTVNPVNLLSQTEQMRYVLVHSDCSIVCVAPEWETRVRAMLASIDRHIVVRVVDPHEPAPPADPPLALPASVAVPRSDDIALLMYTSGTTGVPKGVMLTQSNLACNALSIGAEHALGPRDRVLAVLPLYHINAFAVTMLAPLATGSGLAMPPKFSASSFWTQVFGLGCTWLNVVPTMISFLLEGTAPPRARTDTIRFCRSASAPLAPEQHRGFEEKFGIGIIETMGLTETAAPAFSNPVEAVWRKFGSVGRASGCDARVVDFALNPVADGVTGEIVVRGPNVMRGYLKNPEATAAAFTPDRWLRTGDLGHRDAEGFFFVTGRIKELIIKGGENIAPREIDDVLNLHPAVLEAAAVGIPDRHYGQEILACVVLREGASCTRAALRHFCTERLGPYKTPKRIEFVDSLPRGPSGKVQRLKLLDGLPRRRAVRT